MGSIAAMTYTLSRDTVCPGESVEVSLTVVFTNETDDLRILQEFDPPVFTDVSIDSDDGATIVETTEDHSAIFGSWSGVDSVTLEYMLDVSTDVGHTSTCDISATIESRNDDIVTLERSTEIDVVSERER